MLCIETSTTFGSLQKFEGAAGEFKGALGSRLPLISNPGAYANHDSFLSFHFSFPKRRQPNTHSNIK